MSISSILFTFLLFLVGWASKNKYTSTSNKRSNANFLFIFLIILFESFSFYQISNLQSFTLNGFFMCLPIMPLMVVTFLIETGRIPFDLGEAESELIAGHTTELGGFFFALFYLGEYFHLYCFSITYTLIFFNG